MKAVGPVKLRCYLDGRIPEMFLARTKGTKEQERGGAGASKGGADLIGGLHVDSPADSPERIGRRM